MPAARIKLSACVSECVRWIFFALRAQLNTCKCFGSILGFQEGRMFSRVLARSHLLLSVHLPVAVRGIPACVCGDGREDVVGRGAA